MDEGSNVAATPSKKRNRQKWVEQSYKDGVRIYVKNRGRSERIAKQQMSKPFKFDQFGTGSTAEKAFDISETD